MNLKFSQSNSWEMMREFEAKVVHLMVKTKYLGH